MLASLWITLFMKIILIMTNRETAHMRHRYIEKNFKKKIGAGNETRTRDPDLGKVVLYQLSYSRIVVHFVSNMG